MPNADGWRIEEAKTGKSTCRVCNLAIAAGELRFGQDARTARWFHLGCAAEGAPRAFKPFAAKADKLLVDAKPVKPVATAEPAPKSAKASSAEGRLIAAVRRDPSDREAKQVLADWLQQHGDRWGELIALELAGKTKDAKAVAKSCFAELAGGFGPRVLEWRDGFISGATLAGKDPRRVEQQLAELVGLRAVALTDLVLEVPTDAVLYAKLGQLAPPTLEHLVTYDTTGIAALALPNLVELTLQLRSSRDEFDELERAQLPALRSFAIRGKGNGENDLARTTVVAPAAVTALIEGSLMRRLEFVELAFGALNDNGVLRVLKHADKLRHLRGISIGAGSHIARVHAAFAKQMAAHASMFEATIERAGTARSY